MASLQQFPDRVSETTTTTGTGTITLAGARTGFRSFSTVGNSKSCVICVEAVDGDGVPTGEFEICESVYTSSGTTLSRGRLIASSTGSRVSFAAGTKFVHVVFPSAKIPPHVVYASSVCALDATSGSSGTDVTAALQAVLDEASSSSPLHLIIDGNCLVSGLNIGSYTTFQVLPGCRVWLADDSDRAILRNKNRMQQSDGAIVDTHITLIGGIYEGNRDEQTGIGDFSTQEPDNPGATAGTLIVGLQFFGVSHLRIEHVQVNDCLSIGIHCGYIRNGIVNDVYFDNNSGALQQGGLQFDGGCRNIHITNIRGTVWDDLVAINTDVQACFGGTADLGPYLGPGEMLDISVDGIHCIAALSAFRVMSGVSRYDRVSFRNITGDVRLYVGTTTPLETGNGNVGFVEIDGVQVTVGTDPALGGINTASLFCLDGSIEVLALRRVTVTSLGDDRPLFHLRGTNSPIVGADIGTLIIDDFVFNDTEAGAVGCIPIYIESAVGRLLVSRAHWRRGDALGEAPAFIRTATGAFIAEVVINGLSANRVEAIVDHAAGTLTEVQHSGVRQHGSGATIRVDTGLTIDRVTGSNWNGPLMIDGAGTVTDNFGDWIDTDPNEPLSGASGVEDTFTASNGTALNGRTPSPTTAGFNWATAEGAGAQQTIQSNAASLNATGATQSVVIDAGIADGNLATHAQMSTTSGSGAGVFLRYVDSNNWLLLWMSGASIDIYKNVAGSVTNPKTTSISPGTSSHELGVVLAGSSITCYYDGAPMFGGGFTETAHQSSTKFGIRADACTGTFTEFSIAP